ncbi:hypothetical protein [Anthocerotibacter panamensis]|uniref:hypothetical protein n=1 Tax=Anthocerotibacter panamensis TaxID=2857077 RepID=UPI001C406BCB|nr:hypothetical protein [Anthocerotibacter panamensis]
MSWQLNLTEILNGYFSDQTIEEGVAQMVFVTECDPDYHQECLATISGGIEAALQGNMEVVDIIKKSFAWHVENTHDAKEFLKDLQKEYLSQYSKLT